MDYRFHTSLSEDTRETIGSLLRGHNNSHNSAFFTARDLEENSPKPLNVVVYNKSGAVVGGLIAETQFLWLKVTIMAVAENLRQRGIGRHLLEMAEREAINTRLSARIFRYAGLSGPGLLSKTRLPDCWQAGELGLAWTHEVLVHQAAFHLTRCPNS